MANKISISPAELTAQAVTLSNLSQRLEDVCAALRSIGSSADSASNGAAGIVYNVLVTTMGECAKRLKVGANLAQESADKFTNTDETIRRYVNNGLDRPIDKAVRGSVSKEAMKQPASTQKVTTPRMEKWEDLKRAPTDAERQAGRADFSPGAAWGMEGTYVGMYKDKFVGGSQCYAMAHMMQIEMEGNNYQHEIFTSDGNAIQAGDAVHYWHHDGGKEEEHWIYVYEVRDGRIYYGEGNVDVGGYRGVRYKDEPISNFSSGRWRMENIHRVRNE